MSTEKIDISTDLEAMRAFVARQSPKVSKNVKIINCLEIPTNLLHISVNPNIIKFIPLIGRRQAKQEDRTIPRVCTSLHLQGCITGYAAANQDFLNGYPLPEQNKKTISKAKIKEGSAFLQGGYYIYSIPFKVALKPSKSLVFDAEDSDEAWLVNYLDDFQPYKGKKIGKLFMVESKKAFKDHLVEKTQVYYLETTDYLQFSQEQLLKPGKYRFIRQFVDDATKVIPFFPPALRIGDSEYDKIKSSTVSLLSYPERNFIHWE